MSEWQPIETAPKDGTMILAHVPWLPYATPLFWASYAGDWRSPATEVAPGAASWAPTAWFPMPELPS